MKTIFLSQRVDIVDSYVERRDAVDQRWVDLLSKGGNIVFPVPNNIVNFKNMLIKVRPDMIVLTGGNSHKLYSGQAEERDLIDENMIEYALKNNIPLLGVCRGMQSIAIYYKGTLKQVDNHVATNHDIYDKTGKMIGRVNSYHKYSVNDLPSQLETIVYSADGEIEALRHKASNIYGIMWHPERHENNYVYEKGLLKELFDLEL